MNERTYRIELKLLDVLKAIAEVAANRQIDDEWLKAEIKEFEELLMEDEKEEE